MREILFRGKTIKESFVYGLLSHIGNAWYISNKAGSPKAYEVIPNTIGQYTGLTDKNGKKIFEGDIISYQIDNDDCQFPNKDTKKRIGRVFFQDFRASFAVAEGRNGSDMLNQDLYKYVRGGNRTKVIGNVFDNPELIKG